MTVRPLTFISILRIVMSYFFLKKNILEIDYLY